MATLGSKLTRPSDAAPRDGISLPVLPTASHARQRPRSRIAKWRALALSFLYILITVHILHWWFTGQSIGRFVMSDSMQALEFGEITPGALLFAVSLLLTALFGRFLCGWFCHMGALQDLCAALLRRVGLRPHVFRSRVLGFVPLGLAIYMFLWPTLKREAVHPLLSGVWPAAADFIGKPPEFPGFTFLWKTDHLWLGLPSLWVGIPFILLCGFATVWFLGSRGLCRYGCPYGGFLLPVEQLATLRVTSVDPASCDQCAECTAACTAGVRVHDQIREFGAVLDRNCVKSLDCVSVCPQNNLALRFGLPAALKHDKRAKLPGRENDLGWREELAVALTFLTAFLILRGLYGLMPMLLAAASAVILGYILWKAIALLRRDNVRLGVTQLKLRSRLTLGGRIFAALSICLVLFLAHSAAIRAMILLGSRADDRVVIPFEAALAGQPAPPDQLADARTALAWYSRAQSFRTGGWGLLDTPEISVRVSWLKLAAGDREGAIDELKRLVRSGRAADGSAVSLGRMLLTLGRTDEAVAELQAAWNADQSWDNTRDLLCAVWANTGRFDAAEAFYRARLDRRASDASARIALARLYMNAGRPDDALREAPRAAADAPQNPNVRADYAIILATRGRIDDAIAELRAASNARPAARRSLASLAANILRGAGREREAADIETRNRI